ncbi:hypothetical protein BDV06DRAFT_188247 [Aspergillus oleicola]
MKARPTAAPDRIVPGSPLSFLLSHFLNPPSTMQSTLIITFIVFNSGALYHKRHDS